MPTKTARKTTAGTTMAAGILFPSQGSSSDRSSSDIAVSANASTYLAGAGQCDRSRAKRGPALLSGLGAGFSDGSAIAFRLPYPGWSESDHRAAIRQPRLTGRAAIGL